MDFCQIALINQETKQKQNMRHLSSTPLTTLVIHVCSILHIYILVYVPISNLYKGKKTKLMITENS